MVVHVNMKEEEPHSMIMVLVYCTISLYFAHDLGIAYLRSSLLASATAGVASLTPLASHCMPTQCMSITEVIELSG